MLSGRMRLKRAARAVPFFRLKLFSFGKVSGPRMFLTGVSSTKVNFDFILGGENFNFIQLDFGPGGALTDRHAPMELVDFGREKRPAIFSERCTLVDL